MKTILIALVMAWVLPTCTPPPPDPLLAQQVRAGQISDSLQELGRMAIVADNSVPESLLVRMSNGMVVRYAFTKGFCADVVMSNGFVQRWTTDSTMAKGLR